MARKQQKSTVGKETKKEHQALAKLLNISASTKHCIEIAKALRYKTTAYAQKYLEDVIALRRPVEFKTFKRNVGHKAGIASGRFPQKAAQQFLKLVKAVEANAQFKSLNVDDLKIIKLVANLASIPAGGGRHKHKTKRTHLEIIVRERTPLSKKKKEMESKKEEEEKPKQELELGVEQKTEQKVGSKIEPQKSEPTSQELLKKAQARAAQLNKRESERKSVEEVSKLYSELSQKGTLRETNATTPNKHEPTVKK